MREEILLIVAAAGLILTGCGGSKEKSGDEPFSRELTATVVELGDDEPMMGRPLSMIRVGDAVAVHDHKADSAFHLFNVAKPSYLGQFARKGEGPDEYGNLQLISNINGDQKRMGLFDANRKVYYVIDLDLDSQPPYTAHRKAELEDAWFVNQLASGNIITSNGYVDYYEAFGIYSPDGRLIGRCGDRMAPEEHRNYPPVAVTAAYQVSIEVSPDGKHVAGVLTSPAEGCTFYEEQGDSLRMVNSFVNFYGNPHFDPQTGDFRGYEFGDEPEGILDSASDNDNVYLLTSELPIGSEDEGVDHYTANTILVYNWQGEKQGQYKLDRRVRLITAPDADGRMYAVMTDNSEPTLVYFDTK